jgi:uncharacterized protein
MVAVKTLVGGRAEGEVVVLDEPLSFWGGYDPETGRIIDRRHPQLGVSLVDVIAILPAGRGSSSSTSVLAEAIRLGTAPAGIVLTSPDAIIALGAMVAEELYGTTMPVVVMTESVGDQVDQVRRWRRASIDTAVSALTGHA